MKSYPYRLMLLTVAALLAASPTFAADWPQWRGPNFDGSADAKNLPEKFSRNENLLWAATLPGLSNGTPIIHGDRIFTTALETTSKKLMAICLSRADGKVLWQKEVGTGFFAKGENNMATPSPVTDGKTVWFTFGTGDLAAFDMEGKPVWSRNLQRDIGSFNIMWIYGSSPLLYKGKLFVQVLHTEKAYAGSALPDAKAANGPSHSYLLALDPATGKEIFRQIRSDQAVGETKESYATPVPMEFNGRSEIILIGGDCITSHDPESGTELWRFSGWNPEKISHWRLVPSVVTGAGMIFGCAPKGGPVMAIKAGGNGDISSTHKAWFSDGKQLTSDVPVPLFYKDHLYVLDQSGGKLSKVNPKTGDVIWATKFEGAKAVARSSPTGADNKIYCMNVNGDIFVVSPEDGKVLSKTSLDGIKNARGEIAVADGILVARVGEMLYAFGKK